MAPAVASTTPPVAAPPPAVVHLTSSAPAGWQAYTVQPGDTLIDIAARLGSTPSVIAAQNQLPGGGRLIRVGSVLVVPGQAAPSRSPAAPAAGASTAYTVRRGDTVSAIALRSSASVPQILAANGLGPRSILHPGQVLTIPGAAGAAAAPDGQSGGASAAATPPVTSASYTVQRGDTVEGIAKRTGASQASLIAANALVAPYRLQVGQQLQLPQPAATPANTFAGRTYPQSTVDAAAAARKTLSATRTPSRQDMRAIIERTALSHGIDPKLAVAIGYQESGWDHRQVSVANAIGAMQVIPSSGQWASSLVGRPLNLIDAQDNATAGVVILRALTRSAGSLDEAIAGYYQGLTSVRSKGMYADTVGYVANIKALMARL